MAVITIYLSTKERLAVNPNDYDHLFPNSTKEFASICEKGTYQIPIGWSFGGSHKTNTFKVSLSASPYYIQIFESYSDIKVTKTQNGTTSTVFTGASPVFKKTITKKDYYEVQATFSDYSTSFSEITFGNNDYFFEVLERDGWKVCDPNDTEKSLLHFLFRKLNADNRFSINCQYVDETVVPYAKFEGKDKVPECWNKFIKQNSLAYYVINSTVYILDVLETISGTAITIPNIESEASIDEKGYVEQKVPAIRRPLLLSGKNQSSSLFPSISSWKYSNSSNRVTVFESGSIDIKGTFATNGKYPDSGWATANCSYKVSDNQEALFHEIEWRFYASKDDTPDLYFKDKGKVSNGSGSGTLTGTSVEWRAETDAVLFKRSCSLTLTAIVDIIDYNSLTKPSDESFWNGKEEKCEYVFSGEIAQRYIRALIYAKKMEGKVYNFYSDLDIPLNSICVINNVTTPEEIQAHEYIRITDKTDNLDDFGGYTYKAVPYTSASIQTDSSFASANFEAPPKDFDFYTDTPNILLTNTGVPVENQLITFTISLKEYIGIPTLTIDGIPQPLTREIDPESEDEEYLNRWSCGYMPIAVTGNSIVAIANLDGNTKQINIGFIETSVTQRSIEYRLSASREFLDGAYEWSESVPQVQTGTYLWRRFKYIKSDGTVEYSEALYFLTMQDTIDPISSVTNQYFCLLPDLQIPDSTTVWSLEAPTGWSLGKKYWTKLEDTLTYADGSTSLREGTPKLYTEMNEALEASVTVEATVTPTTYIYNPRTSVRSEPTIVELSASSQGLDLPSYTWYRNGVALSSAPRYEDTIGVTTNETIIYVLQVRYNRNGVITDYPKVKTVYVKPTAVSATPMWITRDVYLETTDPNPVEFKVYYTYDSETDEYIAHDDLTIFEAGITYYEKTASKYFNYPVDLPESPYQDMYLMEGDYTVVQHGNEIDPSKIEPAPYVYSNGQWTNASESDELILKTLTTGLNLTPTTKESISAYKAIFVSVTAHKGIFDNISTNTATITNSIQSEVLKTFARNIDAGTRQAVLSANTYFQLGQAVQAINSRIQQNKTITALGSLAISSQDGNTNIVAQNIAKFFNRVLQDSATKYYRVDEAFSYFVNTFNLPQNAFPETPISGNYKGYSYANVIRVTEPTVVLDTYVIAGGSSKTLNYPTYVRCTDGEVDKTGDQNKGAVISNPVRFNIVDLYTNNSISANTLLTANGNWGGTAFNGIARITNPSATAVSGTSQGTVDTDSRLNQWLTVCTVPNWYKNTTMRMRLDRNGSSNFMQWNVGKGSVEVKVNGNQVFYRPRVVNDGATPWYEDTSFTVSAGDVVTVYFGDGGYSVNHEHSASYSYSIDAQTFNDIDFRNNGFYTFTTTNVNSRTRLGTISNRGTDHEYSQNIESFSLTSPVAYNPADHAINATITCDLSHYVVGINILGSDYKPIAPSPLPSNTNWVQETFTANQGNTSMNLPATIPQSMSDSYIMSLSSYGLNLFNANNTRLQVLSPSSTTWFCGTFVLGEIANISPTSVNITGASLVLTHKIDGIYNAQTLETDFDLDILSSASLSWEKVTGDSMDTRNITSNIARVAHIGESSPVSIYLAGSDNPDYIISKDDLFKTLAFSFTPSSAISKGVFVDDVVPLNDNVSFGTESEPIADIYLKNIHFSGESPISITPISKETIDSIFV